MHPDDVRDYVAACYGELQQQLAKRADLGVKSTELDVVDIYVVIAVKHRAAVAVDPQIAVALAGNQVAVPIGPGQFQLLGPLVQQVPDLGKPVERELLLRIGCDNFDGTPPLAEFLRPADRTPLPGNEWPHDPSNQGIVQAHPKYKRKFFCRPGFREFHEHPDHEDHPWDQIRAESSLAQHVIGLIHDIRFRWSLE